jgi:hypothetical protein
MRGCACGRLQARIVFARFGTVWRGTRQRFAQQPNRILQIAYVISHKTFSYIRGIIHVGSFTALFYSTVPNAGVRCWWGCCGRVLGRLQFRPLNQPRTP